MADFGRWLDDEFTRRGMDRPEFTKRLGMSHVTVGRWLANEDRPSREGIAAIARVLGMDAQEVHAQVDGAAVPRKPAVRSAEDILAELEANQPVAVPVIQNIVAHMGAGGGIIEDYLYLPPAYRRGRRKNILAITATGECMEPNINPGDYVIFDTDAKWGVGDIVVAIVGGEPQVKRLAEIGGKQVLRGDADGSVVSLESVGKDEGVIGRVIMITRPLDGVT